MNLKQLIPIFLAFNFLFISLFPSEAISPVYALSVTDTYIIENDYALYESDSSTSGTIDIYSQLWIKPSDCDPTGFGIPCTGAFGVEYNDDSDKDKYDQDYYDNILNQWGILYQFLTDITDEVPGAGLALVFSADSSAYVALAYFGEKTGIFIYAFEVDLSSASPSKDISINAAYDADGIKEIMVNIGEKVSEVLNLPGFTLPIVFSSLILLATTTYLIKKRKK